MTEEELKEIERRLADNEALPHGDERPLNDEMRALIAEVRRLHSQKNDVTIEPSWAESAKDHPSVR